jgi:hypothetical protein
VRVEYDLDRAIVGVDVVMPLRIQLERQEGNRLSSLREYVRDYAITRARLEHAAPHAIVMHPGPMNEGVEIDPDVAHGERSVVQTQVTNGVAIRMAVLYLLVAAVSAEQPQSGDRLSVPARSGVYSGENARPEPAFEVGASSERATAGAHAGIAGLAGNGARP